jgi:Coenzyme PQQ synthesis protein D (PqqD)
MPLPPTARFSVKPDVVFRLLGAEAILLSLDGGVYFGLNEVGTRIWSLLADHPVDEVARRLSEEFEVTAAEARADVETLAEQLVARGLVVRADEHP